MRACAGIGVAGAAMFLAAFCESSLSAAESIELPSGTVVKPASLEARPKWRQVFDDKQPFFAEKYPDDNLEGMHGRDAGKLRGASVTLHENGWLRSLASFPAGVRQGPIRTWDEDGKLTLYSVYKDGKKHGVTCLLRDEIPWLIQECKAGEVESETLVDREGKVLEDATQLADAQKRLTAAEDAFKEIEQDVREDLHDWFAKFDAKIKAQNVKALEPVNAAKRAAESQRLREERARVAAARGNGAASAVARSAKEDRQAASKTAKKATKSAKATFKKRNKVIAAESREIYDFAMKALEDATAK